MTTILDGPAARTALMLRRTPLYLRLVQSAVKGEWDALDQLIDEPKPRETIHAYRREGPLSRRYTHIRAGRGGGCFPVASYRLVPEQPTDATMRSTARWRAWCETQVEAERDRATTNQTEETPCDKATASPATGSAT